LSLCTLRVPNIASPSRDHRNGARSLDPESRGISAARTLMELSKDINQAPDLSVRGQCVHHIDINHKASLMPDA
jgi:hypothetical protein